MTHRALLVTVCGCCLLLVAGWMWLQAELSRPLPNLASDRVFEVKKGDSLIGVLGRASDQGWLPRPKLVSLWAQWNGLDRGIKAGEYTVPAQATATDLLMLLRRGEVISYSVTLPEGITLRQAITRLSQTPKLQSVIADVDDARLRNEVVLDTGLEGWFLPETYRFIAGDSDLDILRRAHQSMLDVLKQEWNERASSAAVASPYEALILASIVERETAVAEERPEIAGVFTRRLRLGMRLQTDPTVIYGLGEEYRGNLTRKHLRDAKNPWNTYQHKGLPPTPIALPGRDSIRAVLHPKEGESLYFVATGDGRHAFAITLEEHNENVRRYQLNRREDYRSTPVSN